MNRGVSCGGGQSSLGYLFGSTDSPKPAQSTGKPSEGEEKRATPEPSSKSNAAQPIDVAKQIPAGIQSTAASYHPRADGQNAANFITDRPSTKVHAAPGGGSSLGYLFGGGSN